jgi:KDO2-lipid IV(A) lauroyltransferase
MSSRALEAAIVRGLSGTVMRMSWPRSLAVGARIGDAARWAGIRRSIARANLEAVRPAWSRAEVETILVETYRELGRIAVEYPRLSELVRAAGDAVVAEVTGLEHLEAARARGRGAILMTGHFGNFELLGAWLGQRNPVDFVVRPLSNPHVERWILERRVAAGVGTIATRDARRIYTSLRANRWIAMLADQDARRHGVFVPFMGRPASTPIGPARVAIGTGAPIIMGFPWRLPDGRHHLEIEPPLWPRDDVADPVLDLTARHAARLEAWVRRYPSQWFWLHRRWKTQPRPQAQPGGTPTAATSGT